MLTLTIRRNESLHIHRAGREYYRVDYVGSGKVRLVSSTTKVYVSDVKQMCRLEDMSFIINEMKDFSAKVSVGFATPDWSVSRTSLLNKQGPVASTFIRFVSLSEDQAKSWREEFNRNLEELIPDQESRINCIQDMYEKVYDPSCYNRVNRNVLFNQLMLPWHL